MAFYNTLIRRDIRIRHSNTVRVFTSGRVNGRTRFGLSRQLKEWQDPGKRLSRIRVESGPFLKHMFTTRAQLRRFWLDYRDTQEVSQKLAHQLADALGLPARQVAHEMQVARYFGALVQDLRFYEQCRAMWENWARLARLPRAIDELLQAFGTDHQSRRRSPQVLAADTVEYS